MSPNNAEFTQYYERASQGDPAATYLLAWLYFNGYLTEQNCREAACLWHGLAADPDTPEEYRAAASHAYASCCLTGVGVGKDLVEAADLMLCAAELGDALAQRSVGHMYMKGEGCERDPEEAYYWLCMAEVLGCEQAHSLREAVELSLDDNELERALGRGMRSVLSHLKVWSELNREVDAIREKHPLTFEGPRSIVGDWGSNRRHVTIDESSEVRPITLSEAELVRQQARLTLEEFSSLLGVTRMTYHTWRRGGVIRSANQHNLSEVVQRLAQLVKSSNWATVERQLIETKNKLDVLQAAMQRMP